MPPAAAPSHASDVAGEGGQSWTMRPASPVGPGHAVTAAALTSRCMFRVRSTSTRFTRTPAQQGFPLVAEEDCCQQITHAVPRSSPLPTGSHKHGDRAGHIPESFTCRSERPRISRPCWVSCPRSPVRSTLTLVFHPSLCGPKPFPNSTSAWCSDNRLKGYSRNL